MSYRLTIVLLLVAGVFPTAPLAALAAPASGPMDKAQAANEELIKQVIAGATSDKDRAIRLFEAGEPLKDDPAAQRALLTRAVEYGLKDVSEASVRAKVLAAIDMLSAQDEDNATAWLTKKLDVLRAAARAGATAEDKTQAAQQLLGALVDLANAAERARLWDKAVDWWQEVMVTAKKTRPEALPEYRSRMEWAKHFDAAARQAADLVAKLKAKDDLRTRLLLLQVQTAEQDDPHAAVKTLTPEVPEIWRTQLPLAVQKPESLSVPVCRELSRWYAGAVVKDSRTDFGRVIALRRAAAGYNRILDDKAFAASPDRKAVLGEFAAVESQLAKLGASAPRPAEIYICCDDAYDLYVNGRGVGNGWGFRTLRKFEVKLTPGDVIAVRGRDENGGRSAGLFCTVTMRDLTLPSGKDWRYSLKQPANWTTAGPGAGDRPVSVTNIAPEHKGKRFPEAPGQFMWAAEAAPMVFFKLVVPK